MVSETPQEPPRIRVRRRVGYGAVTMPDGTTVQEGEETTIWAHEAARSDFEPIEADSPAAPAQAPAQAPAPEAAASAEEGA